MWCFRKNRVPNKSEVLKRQMSKVAINSDNAVKFYAHLFTVAPQLRAFFKGAENIEPKDVASSERFQKQGQRLLMAMHVLVETWHNHMVFDAYIWDLMNKHRRFKGIDLGLYDAFFGVWAGFLEQVAGAASSKEIEAWASFKKDFLAAVEKHIHVE